MLLVFVGSGTQVKELSTAALGYHKVVKENRKLYNMVQDLKVVIFSNTNASHAILFWV